MPVFANQYNFMGAPLETFSEETESNINNMERNNANNMERNNENNSQGNKSTNFNNQNTVIMSTQGPGANTGALLEQKITEITTKKDGVTMRQYRNFGEYKVDQDDTEIEATLEKITDIENQYNRAEVTTDNEIRTKEARMQPMYNNADSLQQQANEMYDQAKSKQEEINMLYKEKNDMSLEREILNQDKRRFQLKLNSTKLGEANNADGGKNSSDKYYLDNNAVENIMSKYQLCNSDNPEKNMGHRGANGEGNEQDEELEWYCDDCNGTDLKNGCIPRGDNNVNEGNNNLRDNNADAESNFQEVKSYLDENCNKNDARACDLVNMMNMMNNESFTNYEGFDGSLNPSNLNNNQMMNNVVQESENMLNVNLLLKSLLFACLFYILSHESSVKMVKKVVGKMKPDMLNLVMLAVFAVVYYVISMFI